MASQTYERLTALDNSFLMLERPNAYMHVASTMIYDAASAEGMPTDAESIKQLTAARLFQIPRYRQKLAWIPFQRRAVWVDDEQFNIDYHIRHTALPKPGSDTQLKRLSARIMQQHLDRDRPLWEMWIVEGLENDRFAIIAKTHHCMIDGISGVDLMKILMSPTPEKEIPSEPLFVPRAAPSGPQLLRDEWTRRFSLPVEIAKSAGRFVQENPDIGQEVGVRTRALANTLGQSLRGVSTTPFNHPIGPHRRFDWLSMDLALLKSIRRQWGGSLNDVVLGIVTGAVRRFLDYRRVDPATIDFRVMTPVSVRSKNESGALGNRVSAWLADLPVGEPDLEKRLQLIRSRTRELKESQGAIAADLLMRVADWGSSTLLALGARNVTRMLPFNMVVTNVPGPQIPLYTLGARMLEVFPHVPLADNLGLGIALMSYDGKLFWGFNADYDLVPDLEVFVTHILESFDEIRERVDGDSTQTTENGARDSQPADWKQTVALARRDRV